MASATLRPVAIAAVAAAAMLAIAAAPVLAQAERWPARPVRIVVPSPPGSGLDLVSRSIADRLAARWGEAVVVENKPGANSIIGSEAVARAAPDGYTLLLASDSAFTVNPHLYATLPYDPQRDFAPVAQVATLTQLLAVNESLGVRTLADCRLRAGASGRRDLRVIRQRQLRAPPLSSCSGARARASCRCRTRASRRRSRPSRRARR